MEIKLKPIGKVYSSFKSIKEIKQAQRRSGGD
jgi:hypothetical protein